MRASLAPKTLSSLRRDQHHFKPGRPPLGAAAPHSSIVRKPPPRPSAVGAGIARPSLCFLFFFIFFLFFGPFAFLQFVFWLPLFSFFHPLWPEDWYSRLSKGGLRHVRGPDMALPLASNRQVAPK